jgi:hypothetical protein
LSAEADEKRRYNRVRAIRMHAVREESYFESLKKTEEEKR